MYNTTNLRAVRCARRVRPGIALLAAAALAAFAQNASAATIAVTTTADAGPGSLRTAIDLANRDAVVDTVTFKLSGTAPFVFAPKIALPPITAPVVIDGYTQTGSVPATAAAAATIALVLDVNTVGEGLVVEGGGTTIKGFAFVGYGTKLAASALTVASDGNLVQGNHFGTVDGITSQDPGVGILVDGSGNTLGGPDPEDRNVISTGISIAGGTGNEVRGNRIGTNALGTGSLPGCAYGVAQWIDASGTTITDNLISGCTAAISVEGGENVIQGNLIGTDIAGSNAIPNLIGVIIESDGNRIGGPAEGEGNVISGNEAYALSFESGGATGEPAGNTVEGNLIGTDVTGTFAVPNATNKWNFAAVGLWVASGTNTIGGTSPGAENVISGNAGDGVEVGSGATGVRLLGNRIGTDRVGIRSIPNGGDGIEIHGDGNWVGDGSGAGAPNVIAHNGGDGVNVVEGAGNPIIDNAIFANGGLGIDLGPDGPTVDDSVPDADIGANDLQNHGTIKSAVTEPGGTTITYVLETSRRTTIRVDFYWSATCDPSGFGEGFLHLGSAEYGSGPDGLVNRTFNTVRLPVNTMVTATATRIVNGVPSSTSEFTSCRMVTL